MSLATKPLPAAEAIDLIDFDLTMVRFKLANPEEGAPWTPDKLELADREYRRYMALCLAYPDEDIVPCQLVDKMWHQHILDTAAYRADCLRVFGKFHDHFPYFGLRGPDDAANLENAYNVTLDLYVANFGDTPAGAWQAANGKSKCRAGCRPMKCK